MEAVGFAKSTEHNVGAGALYEPLEGDVAGEGGHLLHDQGWCCWVIVVRVGCIAGGCGCCC